MIRTIDLRGKALNKAGYNAELPRAALDVAQAMALVEPILHRVKTGGEGELIKLAQEFDGVTPASIRVPQQALNSALASLDPAIRAALELSIERVRKVHNDQVRADKTTNVVDGGTVTQKWVPVDRVGLYVPGGRAVYPSSVVMNVVPAQIAKVSSIAVASPPQKEFAGLPHPTILATCALLGVTEVFAVGGAQAIAMFAYGVEGLCEKSDLVTGPGNIYVAAAKRALRGVIGIDSEAGPTEIAILADFSARASDVAADLISQAEHDVIAAAILVTDSIELANNVEAELKFQIGRTKHKERITAALSGVQSAIVLVDDMKQGIDVVNAYAAEHLEIQTKNSREDAAQIRNAGAVFIGRFSPVSLGDYSAGSNHVLPTGGCACHSSGLSVQTFLRGLHFIEYGEKAFTELVPTVVTLANSEDLPAHGQAMTIRLENS
ncbi:MAG: histidinol dehydrogenase [Actinobacteria bacterium]|nr:histidinol dehydrogenase [Actinomycetota bacterium]NCV81956.1 histidinol dehydrogenase [Actinomycetota bacterium]NCW43510.1 histidinol dehydrogenase [Actinomycetota bacterium]NCW92264.1 histidinol dehydrogenase [Actinomycetota bacterium]NCX38455.1 histidinol dehydrogenase [Actinomycetota bacterium]